MTAEARPNILLVMADQLVPFLTGAYGHPVVQTPSMLRLAREGVRFDAAYTPCPVCVPARAALLTGRHASEIGVWDNAAPLACDVPTICHALCLAGYDTVASGKLHFVGADQRHGFRARLTPDIYPEDFSWLPLRDPARPERKTHARRYTKEWIRVEDSNRYLAFDENAHAQALQYLRSGPNAPFFMQVSYHHPHEPYHPPQRLWDLYEDAPIHIPAIPPGVVLAPSQLDRWLGVYHGLDTFDVDRAESLRVLRRAYYGLVTYIDEKLGELLAALDETGLAATTTVVFTSDHGDMLGERGMVQKRAFYEWSARVPLLIRLPDRAGAGLRVSEPVSLLDLAPTFLAWAGLESALGGAALPLHGHSLVALLRGERPPPRTVFSEYLSGGVYAPCFMARDARWKYVHIHGADPQLFDLGGDPGEWSNLAGQARYAAVEAALRAQVLARFDPERIEAAICASLAPRELIRDAMARQGASWGPRGLV